MDVVARFRGLSDATRLRIVNLLRDGELCGCDIQHVLGLSQPNVSRHLAYLKHSDLVSDTRRGNRVFYRLCAVDDGANAALFAFLREVFAVERVYVDDRRRLAAALRSGACAVRDKATRTPRRRAAR